MPIAHNDYLTRFNQGFEDGDAGGFSQFGSGSISSVATGTAGIDSHAGGSHGVIDGAGAFTRFDGYRTDFGGGFTTGITVYLDPSWALGQGFEWSVAANGQDGNHQRDFIFHITRDTSTGDLLVAASNNSNGAPREDLESQPDVAVIETAGWYTLQHDFHENDDGVLEVTLSVIDSDGAVVFSHVRAAGADLVASEVGGNRYGWVTVNTVDGGVAVDGVTLSTADTNPFTVHDGNTIEGSYATEEEAIAAAEAGDGTLAVRENGVAGATFYVNEGDSIQAAIDAAAPGDTIVLAAGTYNEDLVVNEGVTLLGANAGAAGNGVRGAESVLTGQITVNSATAATIDGVTVSYDGDPAGMYNAVYLVTAGHTVTNSAFLTTAATGASETRAILMGPQATGSFTITDNYIGGVFNGSGMFGGANAASWNRGIWSDGGGVSLTITGNVIDHVRSGMNLDSFNSGTSDVSGNTLQNVGTGISVGGIMDGPALTGIHDNSFTNASTDLNLQNIPEEFTFDADATNNTATDQMVIIGGTHGDSITGTEGADYIDAESLNTDTANPDSDTLYGLGGDDVLLGKDGDDVLDGGEGADNMQGGSGNDLFIADAFDTLSGGDGLDTAIVADLAAAQAITASGIEVMTDDAGTFFVFEGMSIQDAINAASEGDTIMIGAGVYTGNLTINTDGLTLIAADGAVLQGTLLSDNGIGEDLIDYLNTHEAYGGASGTAVHVAASGVSISGLTIDGYRIGVDLGDGTDGLTLTDIDVTNTIFGIDKATEASVSDVTVNGGSFVDVYLGMNIAKSATDGVGNLDGFVMNGTSFDHLGEKGMYFETLMNALITNITMNDVGAFGRALPFTPTQGGESGSGLELNLKFDHYSNIVIDGFTFTNVGESTGSSGNPHTGAAGIQIKLRTDGGTYGPNPATFDGSVIVRNGSIDGTSIGIRQGEAGRNVTGPTIEIENVTISNALVAALENVTTSPMLVTGTMGDDVLDMSAATTGSVVFDGGPGADTLTGGAGKDTFIADADDTLDGGAGTDMAVVSDLATAEAVAANATSIELISDGAGTFYVVEGMSIQAAIDAAADGDTIILGAGVFAEQLVIDGKNISIIGQGDDTVIEAPAGTIAYQAGAAGNRASIITVVNADNVTIEDLMIDGEGRGHEIQAGYSDFHGVAFINAGGSVDDVTVTGIRAPLDGNGDVSGGQQGRAIYANNVDGSARSLSVSDSTVSDFQKNGIDLRGAGLTVTVTGNEVSGNGATPTNAQNGIVVLGAVGTVSGNSVSEIGYVMTGSNAGATSAGILTFNTSGVVIDGNTITAPTEVVSAPNELSAAGVSSVNDSDGSEVTNNEISGFSVGILSDGDGAAPNQSGNVFTDNDVNVSVDGITSPSVINGSEGADSLVGSSGADTINGLGGDDSLDGGAGDDTLDGGEGADSMIGGSGNDTFRADASDMLDGGDGTDTAIVADMATAQALAAVSVELMTDGNGNFFVLEGMSIQAAINAAEAGDTIYLEAGTFTGNIALNKDVTLVGADGAASTIAGVINVTADGATIDGLHITGGQLFGPDMGVHVAADDVTISNSFIEGSGTSQSAGVTTSYGSTVTGLTLSDNQIEGWVYGAYFNPSVQVTATGNTFDNNTNAGLAIDGPLPGSTISGNTFTATGGGLGLGATAETFDASEVIFDNTFLDQDGQTVVGIYAYGTLLGGSFTTQTVTGTDQNDYMSGEYSFGVTDQVFDGGAGDDVIEAFGGDDILIGGEGDDSLNGGLGADVADYSGDTDGLVISGSGPNAISVAGGAGVGSDTLAAIERIIGGSGNDQFNTDRAEFEILASLTKESFALGEDGVWTITGDGVDTIDGGRVIHDLNGQTFLLVGGNSFATVEAALASGIEGTIVVGATPDPDPEVPADPIVVTFDEDDFAEDDDDIIEVVGTDAVDTVDITVDDNDGNTIIVTGNEATGEVFVDLDGDGQVDLTFSGIEEVVLNGSNIVLGGDFTGTGVSNDTIVMNGTSGNDVLDGSAVMSDETQEAYGYEGDDTISTAGGDDYVDAGEGSDTVNTGDGDDLVIGNIDAANDSYNGGAGNDTIDYSADTEGFNINLTTAGAAGLGIGNDTAAGFENVIGGSGSDGLIGNGADNRITGGLGDDDIRGLNGIDTAVINAAASNGIASQLSGGRLIVETDDGSDVLRTIEFVEFANATIAVNATTGNAHAWGGADTDEADEGGSGDGPAATGNVLANDIEIEGEAVTVTGVAAGDEAANSGLTTGGVAGAIQGAYGALTLNADGTYSYVVNNESLGAGETATDTFTYRVSDGEGGGDLTTITFTVSGENDAPVIVTADGSADVIESAMVASDTGAIVFSDLDTTDDLTVSDDSASTTITWDGGSLSMGQEAAIRAGFTLDNTSFDNSGTVNWTYSASAADLDFLAEGETVTFDVTVTVTDDSGEGDNSVTSVVSVTITGTNDVPTVSAINGAATDEDDTSYELNLLTDAGAADVDQTDVLSVADVEAVSSNMDRTVVFSIDEETGAFSVDATQFDDLAVGESETITVTYDVIDGNGGVTSNTATFVVNGVNDAPVAPALDAGTITEDDSNPYSLDLLQNATDVDLSDDLDVDNVTVASSNMGRTVAFLVDEETGELTLDPDQFDDLAAGESETITVTYDVIDGNGAITPTTATFVVDGVNDDPVADDDSPFQMDEDTGGTIDTADLVANDADDDTSDMLTVSAVSATSAGGALLTLNGDGTISYDSNGQFEYLAAGESTTDTFTYTVDDGNGGTDEATVTVTVNGVNDGPVGVADTNTADENGAGSVATGNVLANDTDADTSDILSIASVNGSGANVGTEITLASGALLTVNADGSYSYDANGAFEDLAEGETTTDSFQYNATDSNGGFTGFTTVTLTITGSNDAPTVGAAVTATANEDDADFSADLLDGAADVDNGAELSVTNASVAQTDGTAFDLTGFVYDIDADGQLTFDADQFDSLGEDDDIELTFSYDVEDEFGATVSQTAVVTIEGENDEPEFIDPDATPAAFDENGSLIASGDFDFDGTDRTDTHTASASLTSATVSGGGSLTMAQQNALAAALTALVNGSSVEWDFDASAANFDSLNPGQNVTATYTVTVDDGEGGTDTRTVTVTINGDFENQTAPDGGGTVTGSNLDDNITGSGDDDTLNAGGGDNLVNAGGGDDSVTSGSGDDTINGGGGDDTIASGSGNDTIDGGAGDDDINAGSGNDLVFSSAGDDILRGGSGIDTVSFVNAGSGITINLALSTFQTTSQGMDQYIGFENVIGSAFADTFMGNDGANVFEGGAGNDTYYLGVGDSLVEQAGGGTDRIFTSAATFTLGGNVENIFGQSAGGHTFTGDDGANTMVGNSGNDTLIGGLGGDTLLGQAGNDIMYGGAGAANTMQGGLGDDTYYVEANDSIVELAGQGTDTVITTRNTFTLNGNVENLSFNGAGNFTGTGNVLNNVITGGSGNDTLMGGLGNDTLNGGDGIDIARVSGLSSGYSVTREGAGWRIIDTNLGDGDDGSDFVMNMETLRFGNGATMSLAIELVAPALTADKGGYDGPQVLPGLSEDDFVFSKFDDTPLVLPGSDGLGDSLFGALELSQPALQDNLLVRDGFMDQLLPDDGPAFTGRHDDWMM